MLISIIFVILIWREYRDFPSFQLASIIIMLFAWIVIVTYVSLLPLYGYDVDESTLKFHLKIGVAIFYLSLIQIGYIQINPKHHHNSRIIAFGSIICFVILLSFILNDLLTDRYEYYEFSLSNGLWFPSINLIVSILGLIGISGLFVSYLLTSRKYFDYPEYLISSFNLYLNRSYYLVFVIIQVAILIGLVFYPAQTPLVIGALLVLNISFFCVTLSYFSWREPFMHIGYGANPNKLIENNIVGYFLGTTFDDGPSVIKITEEFIDKTNIEKIDIQGLNLGVITMIGINNSFQEQVSIVPIPKNDKFLTLIITFFTTNSELKDKRIRNNTPSVFGLIFPSVLAVSIGSLKIIKQDISQLFKKNVDINDLSDQFLIEISGKILDQVIF